MAETTAYAATVALRSLRRDTEHLARQGALTAGELARRDMEHGARRILDATANLNETDDPSKE